MRQSKFHLAIRKFEPFEIFLKDKWEEFCQETGCTLELEAEALDLPELHQRLLSDEGLKNGDWDLALISADWLREACENQCLLPLDDIYPEQPLSSIWSDSLLRAQFYNGKHYGIPFHDGPECLIYRKDLFEDPENCSKFLARYGYILEPPKNWDTFLDVAHFFQNKDKGLYGTALAAFPDGHNAVYDFCIHVWSRGGEFILPDGSICFDSPKVLEALQYYRNLIQDKEALHPDSRQMESVALGMAFAKAELAMMINWFGFATFAASQPGSLVGGKIGVTHVPHQIGVPPVAPNSYWVYGVGTGSKQVTIAKEFIRFATSIERDEQLTLQGGIGCRKSTWHSERINQQIPFFADLEAIHENARELPDTPAWPKIAAIIDEIMTSLANTQQSTDQILQRAQKAVDALQIFA